MEYPNMDKNWSKKVTSSAILKDLIKNLHPAIKSMGS